MKKILISEVQRKIVKNKYLDDLLTTIDLEEPLPNITLAYKDGIKLTNTGSIVLDDSKLDILDGLQRTYRLWAFWKIYTLIKRRVYQYKRFDFKS